MKNHQVEKVTVLKLWFPVRKALPIRVTMMGVGVCECVCVSLCVCMCTHVYMCVRVCVMHECLYVYL